MIDYISGKIADLSPTRVVIDNQGIGYCMEITLQTYSAFENKEAATVYIQSQVNQREGTQIDYGFSSKNERDLFRLITSVSGMGAGTARMLLSSLSVDEFREAILSEDVNKIKSVKGIGLKGAQRVILELKDKLFKGDEASSELLFSKEKNSAIEEATSALIMLGFSKQNISKAIQSIVKDNSTAKVEDIIKLALKIL